MKNRLKVLRAMRDWSQAQLGEELDVSRQAVNAIEMGKYEQLTGYTSQDLRRIQNVYNIKSQDKIVSKGVFQDN